MIVAKFRDPNDQIRYATVHLISSKPGAPLESNYNTVIAALSQEVSSVPLEIFMIEECAYCSLDELLSNEEPRRETTGFSLLYTCDVVLSYWEGSREGTFVKGICHLVKLLETEQIT